MLHPKDGGPPSKRLRPDNPVRCCCPCAPCVSVLISGFNRPPRALSRALRSVCVWGASGAWGWGRMCKFLSIFCDDDSGVGQQHEGASGGVTVSQLSQLLLFWYLPGWMFTCTETECARLWSQVQTPAEAAQRSTRQNYLSNQHLWAVCKIIHHKYSEFLLQPLTLSC